jgi:hypothetical protein
MLANPVTEGWPSNLRLCRWLVDILPLFSTREGDGGQKDSHQKKRNLTTLVGKITRLYSGLSPDIANWRLNCLLPTLCKTIAHALTQDLKVPSEYMARSEYFDPGDRWNQERKQRSK